ncbi:MAG: glutamate 5-kinase [Chloroflexi bacterium]|nr:glutamate 5-kinase [Chloroflexota bacterium]
MTGERLRPQHLEHRRVVVKVGSNVLTAGTDQLDARAMAAIAEQIGALCARGGQVVLVTSGAIAAGRHRVGASMNDGVLRPRDVHSRQVLAAIGQSRLMALWDELFEQSNVVIAQALLTRYDLADRLAYLNARNTLLGLLDIGVVPIVNENDVVSVEEIAASAIGDNDNLSAHVATLIDADLLLILTDIAGLYTADPARDPAARLIERVERVDDATEQAARGAPGARGTGGMLTKVQAARIATQSGTHVVLAHGLAEDVVLRAASGEPVGTHFLPTGDRMESRLRYLLSGLQARGRIVIDDGAALALLRASVSLLPAGVVECNGDFKRGDVVQVVTRDGRTVARGIVNYTSSEVERIRGKHSDQIIAVLGYEYGEEIVHRNNMVIV